MEGRDERNLEYHPGCYAIFDCREGVAQLAIERIAAFENKPDKVSEILASTLSKALRPFGLDIEIRPKLREESPVQTTTEELELGATELTYVTNYLLCALTDRMMTTQAMLKLTQSLMAHADAFAAVEACFQPKLWTSHANQCVAMLGQYAEGQERLSTTLLQQLEEWSTESTATSRQGMGLSRAEGLPAAEAGASTAESSLRIGYKKLSRALIVLDAMIQQGWIVDREGNKPRNRDAALNEILQRAFGEEKARQISSTMYPSHIPSEVHEEYRKNIISELLELTSKRKITP